MADIKLNIIANAQKAKQELGTLSDRLKNLVKSGSGLSGLSNAFQELTGSSLGGVGAIMAVGGALRYSIGQAIEAERAMAATEAVILATGGAAGYTAEEIAALAGAESRLTSIDDEVIQSGLNMLLTFKQIGGETLPRATRAMEDMAVAMAKGDTTAIDLQGTAIQLGKALNDPIAGASALRRVGVTLSEQQEQQIRDFMAVNDVASAQAVILAELENEFGGMAEAMGGTNAGKIQKARNAIDNLSAAIGGSLLPVLGDAADATNRLMTWNEDISMAYQRHKDEVFETASSYRDYQTEMIRAALVAGELDGVERRRAEALLDGTIKTEHQTAALQQLSSALGLESELLFNARDATTAWMDAHDGIQDTAETIEPAVVDVSVAMRELTTELLFNQAAAGLDAEAALELAGAMGLVEPATVSAMTRLSELKTKYDENADGTIDAAEAAAGYTREVVMMGNALQARKSQLDDQYDEMITDLATAQEAARLLKERVAAIPDRTVTITVEAEIDSRLEQFGSGLLRDRSGDYLERAVGGPVWPGQDFIVGENGPEHLRIGSGGVGMVTPVVNNYNLSFHSAQIGNVLSALESLRVIYG